MGGTKQTYSTTACTDQGIQENVDAAGVLAFQQQFDRVVFSDRLTTIRSRSGAGETLSTTDLHYILYTPWQTTDDRTKAIDFCNAVLAQYRNAYVFVNISKNDAHQEFFTFGKLLRAAPPRIPQSSTYVVPSSVAQPSRPIPLSRTELYQLRQQINVLCEWIDRQYDGPT